MNKREKWEWIKENVPDIAELILVLRKHGLNPGDPDVHIYDQKNRRWIPIQDCIV